MIHINLLPHQTTERLPSQGKELGAAAGVFALSLAAILTANAFHSAQLDALHLAADDLEKQITALRKQNQLLTDLNIRRKDLQEKIHTLGGLAAQPQRAAAARIFDELSLRTPDKLWLTEYTEHDGFAQIRGKSLDHEMIATFARNLSESRYLSNVEIRETQEDLSDRIPHIGKSGAQEEEGAPPAATTQFLIEAIIEQNRILESGGLGR